MYIVASHLGVRSQLFFYGCKKAAKRELAIRLAVLVV